MLDFVILPITCNEIIKREEINFFVEDELLLKLKKKKREKKENI